MKPWQRTYETAQTALEVPDAPSQPKRSLASCGVLAPETGVRVCLKPFSGAESFCAKVDGHDGGHSTKPSACNRPAGHEGPHTFIVTKNAKRLGEW